LGSLGEFCPEIEIVREIYRNTSPTSAQIFPPSSLQSNDQHAKSLFTSPPQPYKAIGYMLNMYILIYLSKSSSPLPFKAMGYMPSHYLNLPPRALQSNDQHARSLFKASSPLPYRAMGYMMLHAKSLLKSYPLCPAKRWAACLVII
jgi:hypothetical protein